MARIMREWRRTDGGVWRRLFGFLGSFRALLFVPSPSGVSLLPVPPYLWLSAGNRTFSCPGETDAHSETQMENRGNSISTGKPTTSRGVVKMREGRNYDDGERSKLNRIRENFVRQKTSIITMKHHCVPHPLSLACFYYFTFIFLLRYAFWFSNIIYVGINIYTINVTVSSRSIIMPRLRAMLIVYCIFVVCCQVLFCLSRRVVLYNISSPSSIFDKLYSFS